MPLPPHTYKKEIVEDPIEIRIPEHEDEKKFHIFQTLENNRMLHALQNWDWFANDKPKLLQYLADFTQRPIAMLRMDSGWKHRLKMENIEALESVKTNMTRFRSNSDYWKLSLRENWGKIENFQNGYFHGHHGDTKIGLIRIGDSQRDSMPAIVFFKDSSWQEKQKTQWSDFDWFVQELQDALSKAQFFYPKFWYLKIKGELMKPPKWWPDGVEDHNDSEEETMMEVAEDVIDFIDQNIDLNERPPKEPVGPIITFSRASLLFCIKPGEIVERTLTLRNKGTVVLFYSWERRPVQPLVLPGRKKDGKRFFTLMSGTGSVLPGQFKKFFFKFYSNQVGTHLENWHCRVYPKPNREVKHVKLKGVTIFDDKKPRWQTQLERVLDYREMMRGIGEALHDVMETAAKASRATTELRDKEYINSIAAFNFMQKNLKLNPPLYFTPSKFKKLEKFAQIVMPHGEIMDTPSSKKETSQMEASQAAQSNEILSKELNKKNGKEHETTKKKNKKDRVKFKDTMSTFVSPPEIEATDTHGNDKKTKTKKEEMSNESSQDKIGMKEKNRETSSLLEEKGVKQHKDGKRTSKQNMDVSTPQMAEKDIHPNINISPYPISREDMFCKPCIETYIPPPPTPLPPPPPSAWAGSVSSILLAIKACPNKKQRRALKLEMRDLLEEASIPPHQTTILLMAMYKTLHQISGDFEYIMETVTEESGRPVAEQLFKIYYDQVEKEQALAEEAERFRETQTDFLNWPFDEDDSNSAILANEYRTEVKKQEAEDVVHYLMRWTHVLTEARGIVKYGVGDFQEQVEKDQRTVALLIEEKLHDLSSLGLDADACWKAFDLERKKQVLQEEFTQLPPCHLPSFENLSSSQDLTLSP